MSTKSLRDAPNAISGTHRLKLDGVAAPTGQAMLSELAAAKAGGRAVGLFEDSGVVLQLYAW
jgi:hypothetical protein